MNTTALVNFAPVPAATTRKLLDFAQRNNLGKTIEIDGETYVLDHMSIGKSAFFRSRSCSIYYKVGRSIIRISDHWSHTPDRPRSRKLNCGQIGGKFVPSFDEDGYYERSQWKTGSVWALPAGMERIQWTRYAGKYPWELYAGRAGLVKLNKSVDHWKES